MSFFQQGIQAGDFVAHCRDAFTVSGLNDFTLAEVAHISERAFLRHQAIFEDVERLTVLQCDDLELAASIAKAGASAASPLIASLKQVLCWGPERAPARETSQCINQSSHLRG